MKARTVSLPGVSIFKALLLGALTASASLQAAIPPAEKLLPADALLVISAPDWTTLHAAWNKTAPSQFLDDPAMKQFRDKFLSKFKEEIITPLERELDMKLENYDQLAQGQMTLAVTQEGWQGGVDPAPALLFLLDAKSKGEQLKTNLTELRKKWVDAGKSSRTETIRNVEFWVVPLSSNAVPRALLQFLPHRQEIHELGESTEKKKPVQNELVIGQYDSLLIAGTSIPAVEKVMAHLTGGSAPALADEAVFDADQVRLFRDAPLFAWFNAKRFVDITLSQPEEPPNPEAPSPLPTLSMNKILTATGLSALKSVAFAWRSLEGGMAFEMFFSVPDSARVGLFQILAADAKDSSPPPFVPADVLEFQRTRIDGQKAITALEKMVGEISPAALRFWNFALKTGGDAFSDGDNTLDLRKDLLGNLGDDIITYTKPPRGDSAAELNSPPSLMLFGSATADKMASSLKGLLAIVSPLASPKEREFLGKKIYTVSVSRSLIGMSGAGGRDISYAASGGYLAITTDTTLLEEFIRSGETPPKPLRERSGLAEAAQAVGGQSTGMFSYENKAEKMRIAMQLLKVNGGSSTNNDDNYNPFFSAIPFASPEKSFRDWLDYSLLPSFDKISKYFHFDIYSGSASPEGISFKYFAPTPPELKK